MGGQASKSTPIDLATYKFPEFDEGPDFEERVNGTFTNKKGSHTVFYRTWKPKDKVKGVILGMHGVLEHGGKYARVAHDWVKEGYVVVFGDHEGHGKTTGGARGDFLDINDLVEDQFELLYSHILPSYPSNIPVFLFGHSMGSIVCGLLAHKCEVEGKVISGYILSGCAVKPGPSAFRPLNMPCLYALEGSSAANALGKFLRTHAPTDPSSPIVMEACINDKDRLEQNRNDPLMIHAPVQNRAGFNTILGAQELMGYAPSMKTPVLIFHGENDTVTLPVGSQLMYDKLTGTTDKKIVLFKGEVHEVLYDNNYQIHNKEITQWIDAHVASFTLNI